MNFTECENKRDIKGQMRVVLRTVLLALFTVWKELVGRGEKKRSGQRQAGPVTNDSQVNLMIKLRRITHDIEPCFMLGPSE